MAEYEAGMTAIQVAETYAVSKGTVLRLLEDHGVTRRQQPMTDQQAAEAIQLYLQGWSLIRVGNHFGREHTVIRDILRRAGIPRRDSHGRPR